MLIDSLVEMPTRVTNIAGITPSSETQGQIARQGKCKRAKESGDEQKHRMARRAPGNKFLPDQFQTVEVILNSDWAEKHKEFLAPIRIENDLYCLELVW